MSIVAFTNAIRQGNPGTNNLISLPKLINPMGATN